MRKINLFRLLPVFAALALLPACGGGGGSDSPSDGGTAVVTSLTGVVADGYLSNATVFLDLNDNKLLDAGEPSTETDEQGNYTLADIKKEDAESHNVVVLVKKGVTVDQDNPAQPVAKDYLLSSPVGKEAFISPVTTLVARKVEAENVSADAAAAALKDAMGAAEATIDLFANYLAQEDLTGQYAALHKVAQTVADALGSGMEQLEAVAGEDAGVLVSGTVSLVADAVTDNITNVFTAAVANETTALEAVTNEVTTGLAVITKADLEAAADSDGDGVNNAADNCPTVANADQADLDQDGIGDLCDDDLDGDGALDADDAFASDPAASVDADGDSYPDQWNDGKTDADSTTGLVLDVFPGDAAEWADADLDGYGDNAADAFPADGTEWADTDGDGVGNNGDAFPDDATESADSDGDGVGDNGDAFPNDPAETLDSDGDGVGNNGDAFPNDATETADSDGDGVGNNADAFPNDPAETLDSDGDGMGDNSDPAPFDPNVSSDDVATPFAAGIASFTDGSEIGDNGLMLDAADSFAVAQRRITAGTEQNLADSARFFNALGRVVRFAFDTQSDGDLTNGYHSAGDVLDGFNADADFTTRSTYNTITLPETCTEVTDEWGYTYLDCDLLPMPSDAPTTGDLLGVLQVDVAAQLQGAVADLNAISSTFNYAWTDPVDQSTMEFDYGDVLMLKAMANAALGKLLLTEAYQLDGDIDQAVTKDLLGQLDIQTLMGDNPNAGKLASGYQTKLTASREAFRAALTTLQSAITAVEGEGDDQIDDFVTLIETDWQCDGFGNCVEVDVTAEEIATLRSDIETALAALDGEVTVDDNMTPGDTSDDAIFDFSQIFAGIDLRALLPAFAGDEAAEMFPDPTLGGVVVQDAEMNINEDLDGNGIPDLLEDANFYEALLDGKSFDVWLSDLQGTRIVDFAGNGNGTGTFDLTYWDEFGAEVNESGTWAIISGDLLLTFADATSLTITLVDSWSDVGGAGFSGEGTYSTGETTWVDAWSGGSSSDIVLPYGEIAIDGATGDWTNIAPIIVDGTGDSTGTAATDIDTLYAAQDAGNIYLRMDLAGNYTFPHTPLAEFSHYDIGVFADDQTGVILENFVVGLGTSADGTWDVADLARYDVNWVELEILPLTYSVVGNVMEVAIPKSVLPVGTTGLGLYPNVHSDPLTGGPIFDAANGHGGITLADLPATVPFVEGDIAGKTFLEIDDVDVSLIQFGDGGALSIQGMNDSVDPADVWNETGSWSLDGSGVVTYSIQAVDGVDIPIAETGTMEKVSDDGSSLAVLFPNPDGSQESQTLLKTEPFVITDLAGKNFTLGTSGDWLEFISSTTAVLHELPFDPVPFNWSIDANGAVVGYISIDTELKLYKVAGGTAGQFEIAGTLGNMTDGAKEVFTDTMTLIQ